MKKHLVLTSENITRLSKNISKSLKLEGFDVSHNQILSFFAKSLGFPSLHAAQNQNFMQERKEPNQYVVEVQYQTITSNYYDVNEDFKINEKAYFLFSGFESKNFNFHLIAEFLSLFDTNLTDSSKKLFEQFITKRNDGCFMNFYDFINLILDNSDYRSEIFKTQSDINEFDQIFINEMKETGEVIVEDNGGAIIDFKVLNTTPENIQFMIDNNMIDGTFLAS